MKPRQTILPVFLDHAGCRQRCAFCNQRSSVGAVAPVSDQIDRLLDLFVPSQKRPSAEMAFYGGDFLRLPQHERDASIAQANNHPNGSYLTGFRCSVRPDSIDAKSAETLAEHNFTTVEIGAQCLNDGVLFGVNRNHTREDVENAAAAVRSTKMKLGLQLMLGLPDQTEAITQASNRAAANCRPDFVRLFPTVVLKGTELADRYSSGAYKPLSHEAALALTAQSASFFQSRQIRLAQIGLHASESIVKGTAVVAGPFDPRFGEKVRQRISQETNA